jgi:hypothetical protein
VQRISEKLVESIVREVIAELRRRGVDVPGPSAATAPARGTEAVATRVVPGARLEMDFSGYRTPVLTERLVRAAAPSVTEIVVPAGTYCTEGARDMLEKRKLTLTFKNPSH